MAKQHHAVRNVEPGVSCALTVCVEGGGGGGRGYRVADNSIRGRISRAYGGQRKPEPVSIVTGALFSRKYLQSQVSNKYQYSL